MKSVYIIQNKNNETNILCRLESVDYLKDGTGTPCVEFRTITAQLKISLKYKL